MTCLFKPLKNVAHFALGATLCVYKTQLALVDYYVIIDAKHSVESTHPKCGKKVKLCVRHILYAFHWIENPQKCVVSQCCNHYTSKKYLNNFIFPNWIEQNRLALLQLNWVCVFWVLSSKVVYWLTSIAISQLFILDFELSFGTNLTRRYFLHRFISKSHNRHTIIPTRLFVLLQSIWQKVIRNANKNKTKNTNSTQSKPILV